MSFTLVLILWILAIYRVAHLVALEDGPFDLLVLFREFLFKIFKRWDHWVIRGFACPLCISFWLAIIPAVWLGLGILGWLGIAGAVLTIHQVLYRR